MVFAELWPQPAGLSQWLRPEGASADAIVIGVFGADLLTDAEDKPMLRLTKTPSNSTKACRNEHCLIYASLG